MTRCYASSLGRERHRAAISGICDGTATPAAPRSAPEIREVVGAAMQIAPTHYLGEVEVEGYVLVVRVDRDYGTAGEHDRHVAPQHALNVRSWPIAGVSAARQGVRRGIQRGTLARKSSYWAPKLSASTGSS